jgi:CRISPR system Cascade subunit CasE
MSYLSRIWINPRRNQSRRFLQNPQTLHAAVLAGIPRQPVEERVLWRVDADDPLRPALFVLSASQPSWEHLVEQAGWPSANDPEDPQAAVKAYDPLLTRLRDGDVYAFRLTANPVRASRSRQDRDEAEANGNGRSKRRGCVTVEQQTEWLLSRAARLGMEILDSSAPASGPDNRRAPDLRISARENRSFQRRKGARPVTLRVVTYEGRLRVTDRQALATSLTTGIGPAKAYGCGLMTLAPVGR